LEIKVPLFPEGFVPTGVTFAWELEFPGTRVAIGPAFLDKFRLPEGSPLAFIRTLMPPSFFAKVARGRFPVYPAWLAGKLDTSAEGLAVVFSDEQAWGTFRWPGDGPAKFVFYAPFPHAPFGDVAALAAKILKAVFPAGTPTTAGDPTEVRTAGKATYTLRRPYAYPKLYEAVTKTSSFQVSPSAGSEVIFSYDIPGRPGRVPMSGSGGWGANDVELRITGQRLFPADVVRSAIGLAASAFLQAARRDRDEFDTLSVAAPESSRASRLLEDRDVGPRFSGERLFRKGSRGKLYVRLCQKKFQPRVLKSTGEKDAHLQRYHLGAEHALESPPGSGLWYVCAPRGLDEPEEDVPVVELPVKGTATLLEFTPGEHKVVLPGRSDSQPRFFSLDELGDAVTKKLGDRGTVKFSRDEPSLKIKMVWNLVDGPPLRITWGSVGHVLGFAQPVTLTGTGTRFAEVPAGANFGHPYPGFKLNTNKSLPKEPSILLPCCGKTVHNPERQIVGPDGKLYDQNLDALRVVLEEYGDRPLPKVLKWWSGASPGPARVLRADKVLAPGERGHVPSRVSAAWGASGNQVVRVGVEAGPQSILECLRHVLAQTVGELKLRLRAGIGKPLSGSQGLDEDDCSTFLNPVVWVPFLERSLGLQLFLYEVSPTHPRGTIIVPAALRGPVSPAVLQGAVLFLQAGGGHVQCEYTEVDGSALLQAVNPLNRKCSALRESAMEFFRVCPTQVAGYTVPVRWE
jgi:hypothetical protein